MSTTRTRQAGNDPGHHRRDVESDGGRRAGGRVGSPQAPPRSVSTTKQLQANPQIHSPPGALASDPLRHVPAPA